KTKAALSETVDTIFLGERRIDPSILKNLETALLSADLGVKPTREILDAVREKLDRNALSDSTELKREIKSHILRILNASTRPDAAGASGVAASPNGAGPRVIFVVGVNGAGKTTSIGKLANRLRQENRSVVLCAADTFRAAAIEQLEIWAERNGVEVIKQKPGADPAAVVYDAMAAAKARLADVVIVDTAGRLHTKSNLMAELEKMMRTAAKVIPGAPHDVLLVLDATTGQNGLVQAREFTSTVGVTGIILTKLDGTAKGGIVGEGFHQDERRDDAEIVALESAKEKARGAVLYVTLEPCSHQGRTGPCTEAIIAAGIARVVAATEDPNPVGSGRGFERLGQAGIEVVTGICEEEARRLNEGFACWIRTKKPFVTLK